jgi:hypothetical protein
MNIHRMELKQRISLIVASVLPVVALAVYFLLAPFTTNATGNLCHAPCGIGGKGCGNGAGGCYNNGSNGIFVFCKNSQGQPMGPGSCSNGYVDCTYGSYC